MDIPGEGSTPRVVLRSLIEATFVAGFCAATGKKGSAPSSDELNSLADMAKTDALFAIAESVTRRLTMEAARVAVFQATGYPAAVPASCQPMIEALMDKPMKMEG